MKNYIYVTGLISFARQGSHRPRPTTNASKTHSTYDEWRRCAFGSHIAKLVRNVATVSDVSKDFQMFLSITKISYIYTVKRKPTKRQWGTIRDVWMMHYRCCTGGNLSQLLQFVHNNNVWQNWKCIHLFSREYFELSDAFLFLIIPE